MLQLQSIRVYKMTHGRPSPPAVKLVSIKHAAPKKPSGRRFWLQVSGTCKFTARKCYGELCSVSTTDCDPLAAFDGKALRVCKAGLNNDGLGKELEVSTAEKLEVDSGNANALLAYALSLGMKTNYMKLLDICSESTSSCSSIYCSSVLIVMIVQAGLISCDRVLAHSEALCCLYASLLSHCTLAGTRLFIKMWPTCRISSDACKQRMKLLSK